MRRTFSVLRWRYVALAYDIQQAEHGGQVGLVHEVRVLPLGSFPSLHPFQHQDQELAWSFCNKVRLPTEAGPSASERTKAAHPVFHGGGRGEVTALQVSGLRRRGGCPLPCSGPRGAVPHRGGGRAAARRGGGAARGSGGAAGSRGPPARPPPSRVAGRPRARRRPLTVPAPPRGSVR